MQTSPHHRFERLSKLAGVVVLTEVAGCTPAVSLSAMNENDPCAVQAQETITLTDELVEIEEATGELDAELTCRLLANEIKLLDDGCITESDLPAGVDRATLVLQQQDFNCSP